MTKHPQTLFGLMRHGRTVWNEEKRIQGQQDSRLSHNGRKRIREISTHLPEFYWDRILCSPLGRCRETAELINIKLDIPLEIEQNLLEQHWGEWTGLTMKTIRESFAEEIERQVSSGWNFCPPGGESRKAVNRRAVAALLAAARRWPKEKILVICHEGVIKSILYSLAGRAFLPEEKKLFERDQLHCISCTDAKLSIENLNFLPAL